MDAKSFFGPEHAALLRDLRAKTGSEEQREVLREVVHIQDRAFLDRLMTMGIGPEEVLALRLIPLVFVAWADGTLGPKEREALLRAAGERGLVTEPVGQAILEGWLSSAPDPRLLARWKGEVRRIWGRFTAAEQWQMRQNLLGTAREVAQAAGGILGLGSISAREKALLEELEALLV